MPTGGRHGERAPARRAACGLGGRKAGHRPDVDALALRCAALLNDKRSAWFWNSIDYRIMKSAAWADWVSRPMTYLEDLDPATAEVIRLHVASTYEKATSAASKRGWEVT